MMSEIMEMSQRSFAVFHCAAFLFLLQYTSVKILLKKIQLYVGRCLTLLFSVHPEQFVCFQRRKSPVTFIY